MTPVIMATFAVILFGLGLAVGHTIGTYGRTKNEEIASLMKTNDELGAEVGALREMVRLSNMAAKLEEMVAKKKAEATRKGEPLTKA
jgi:hypothetical protein